MRTLKLKRLDDAPCIRHEGYIAEAALKRHGGFLGTNDVIVVRSKTKSFLLVVYRRADMDLSTYPRRRGDVRLYHVEKLRLVKKVGDRLIPVEITDVMLQDVFHEAGLHLQGLETSDVILGRKVARKAAA